MKLRAPRCSDSVLLISVPEGASAALLLPPQRGVSRPPPPAARPQTLPKTYACPVTLSGTGFTLSIFVYQGISKKKAK